MKLRPIISRSQPLRFPEPKPTDRSVDVLITRLGVPPERAKQLLGLKQD